MATNTFYNLPQAKQQRIEKALLTEFSQYPLSQAQVARIILQANIARGSFYKYFADLIDAYQYILEKVLTPIHGNLQKNLEKTSANSLKDFYYYTVTFAHQMKESLYCDFYRLFWQENQYYLQTRDIKIPFKSQHLHNIVLKIDNQPVTNEHKNRVVIKLLRQLGHEVIKAILNNHLEEQVFQDFKLTLTIIADGLRQEGESKNVSRN